MRKRTLILHANRHAMQRSLQATRRSKFLVEPTSVLPGLFEEHYSSRAAKQASKQTRYHHYDRLQIANTHNARTLSEAIHRLLRLRRARNISLQHFRRRPRSSLYVLHNL